MAKFSKMDNHVFNKKMQEKQHFSIDHVGKPKIVEKGLRISISSVLQNLYIFGSTLRNYP